MDVRIRRIYEAADPADGFRVLVDRLWPRGIRKDKAALDEWLHDIAPSTELRRWFNHDPARWEEFRRRYHDELGQGSAAEALIRLRQHARDHEPLTLLYAAHDEAHNNAVVLQALLQAGS